MGHFYSFFCLLFNRAAIVRAVNYIMRSNFCNLYKNQAPIDFSSTSAHRVFKYIAVTWYKDRAPE